jgi:DNA-binding MarR family transcriptional regulator
MATRRMAPAATRKRRAPAPEGDADAVLVLREFRLVFNAVRQHFQQVERATGLGGSQAWALGVVGDRPGIGVTELARAMDIHQSTASNLVRTLTERGLVRAARTGSDRRAVQLTVLPAGARALRKAPGPLAGVLPRALAGLDAATLRRLRRDLATLLAALHPDRRAARTPIADL